LTDRSSIAPYLILIAGFTLLAITGLLLMRHKWYLFTHLPLWAAPLSNHFYLRAVAAYYPIFLVIYPVSIYGICQKDMKRGLFLFCLFMVPIFSLSLFAWKSPRFMSAFLPFFLMAIATYLADVSTRIFSSRCLVFRVMGGGLLVLASLYPWYDTTINAGRLKRPDWRLVSKTIQAERSANDAVITNVPMELSYYGLKKEVFLMDNYNMDGLKSFHKNSHTDIWLIFRTPFFENPRRLSVPMRTYLESHSDWFAIDSAGDFYNTTTSATEGGILIGKMKRAQVPQPDNVSTITE